ncbi:MAG: anthranilate synthase component I family protein [Myxococcota bacterium]
MITVCSGPSPEAVVTHLGPQPGTVWLDGGSSAKGWSIVAIDPVDIITEGPDWCAAGRSALRETSGPFEVPFIGGVMGYIGYGAGHRVAPVPENKPTVEPEAWLARFDGAMCYRHADATWHLTGPSPLRARFEALLANTPRELAPLGAAPPSPLPPQSVDPKTYQQAVRRILEWIRAGDCYQVNLSRPVRVSLTTDDIGFSVYRRLRTFDAAYGAFIKLSEGLDIVCNSPELLLAKTGRTVASEPIKGTRPRGATPEADTTHRQALRESSKDQAELTMIVDLVRNDLGRVAESGTVRTGERRIMELPTVFHTFRRVEATLRRGVDAFGALAAMFPPGSVTGAPKIRACHRIAELEDAPRGVYCGSIGFASDHERASFNVAIRTGVVHRGIARYHVGGGVVVSSDPAAEWAETEAKGAAWARALGTHSSSSNSS